MNKQCWKLVDDTSEISLLVRGCDPIRLPDIVMNNLLERPYQVPEWAESYIGASFLNELTGEKVTFLSDGSLLHINPQGVQCQTEQL